MKKIVSLLLALAMLFSLAACGDSGSGQSDQPSDSQSPSASPSGDAQPSDSETPTESVEPGEFQPVTYDYEELYYDNLGEFYDLYMDAKQAENLSERWAKMAVAEAKLLASGTVSLTYSRGGNYAISRVATRTQTSVLYGNDNDRNHQMVVANEFIRTEDQAELRTKWNELRGTGTYLQAAKDFLAEKGYTLNDTYGYYYTIDPTTWDIFATSQQTDTEPMVQTYEGLMEYDCENVLQPAMALSVEEGEAEVDRIVYDEYGEPELDDDGNYVTETATLPTYTFKIREGQSWVDSQGRVVAGVKADDWVAGMQHLFDADGGLQTLLYGVILNAKEYDTGTITDFDLVGVKAVDDYTLVYTLEAPCPYFTTMLGYSIFAPLSRAYYESQGGKFGEDYDASAADYNYGKNFDTIAYSGPYRITSYTDHNSIIFDANNSYWNPDNVICKKQIWYYNDNTQVTKVYEDAKAGILAGAGLNSSSLEQAKIEDSGITDADGNALTYFDAYHYNSATDATTFMGFYNVARLAFANFNDSARMVSAQSHGSADAIDIDAETYTTDIEDDAARTHVAMNNQNFRLALTFAFDRVTYSAVRLGEELAAVPLLNTIVPGTFVSLEEEVTVDINGTSKTFPANTTYGEVVQAALDAYGVKAKVWDSENGDSQGFDGWYNLSEAQKYMTAAISELAAQGVEVSAENPIQVDYIYNSESEVFANMANVYAQCMDAAFEGKVKVNLVGGSSDDVNYATYQPDNGSDMNYDLSHQTGWGPDYGDPATWLDCFLPYGDGYMTTSLGLWHN